MVAMEDEVNVLEGLRDELTQMIRVAEHAQSKVKTEWNESTPALEAVVSLLDDAMGHVEGRITELMPWFGEYYEHNTRAESRQAQEATRRGINYMGLVYGIYGVEEHGRAMEYISEHGLASMDYAATREAVRKFRKAELDALISGRKTA